MSILIQITHIGTSTGPNKFIMSYKYTLPFEVLSSMIAPALKRQKYNLKYPYEEAAKGY